MFGTTRAEISEFLDCKRLAVVGVSRHPNDFTRALFREFAARGYDVIPVNPNADEIEGRRCFARVGEIEPAVEAALLLTPAPATLAVVLECTEAGVEQVWLHRGAGIGAVSDAAVRFCRGNGIKVVAGECPLMFLRDAGWVHRAHGMLRKLVGSYPG
jgi:hypothetical protein